MNIERRPKMKTEIREYSEGYPVEIEQITKHPTIELKGVGRWIIDAQNEGGHNGTEVDLLDVIDWVKQNKPELLK